MRTDQERLRQRSHAEFVLLGTLAPDDPRREEARDHLVALHLPLVKQLARRLGSRGEPVEDLIQVGTIGLIKAVDRSSWTAVSSSRRTRRRRSSARSSAGTGTRAGRSGCPAGCRSFGWHPP